MKIILFAFSVSALALAQAAKVPPALTPVLLPGEGLAIAGPTGLQKGYGESKVEAPMGSLAELLWLRLEGDDWGGRQVAFKCKGEWNGFHCWNPKGHGRVDLAKATSESCNLAFLFWAMQSVEGWKHDYGEGAARLRLELVFKPFLGNRLPAGDVLPVITPAWVGEGDLLRTTPEALATWMADQDQEELRNRFKRLMGGAFDGWIIKGAPWWFKTGISKVSGDTTVNTIWVAGSDGESTVVLHLPKGRGPTEGLARMKEILHLPKK